jgi:hydroxypyruvate isomerase
VSGTWDKVKSRVAHIQVGGVPDRHEPSGGDFDYPAFFRLLDWQNYKGWVSGEYHPAARTNEDLSWIS